MTFADWLDAQPEHDGALARRLGMSKQRLSYYRHLQRVPRPAEMFRLMRLTGLPIEAFFAASHQQVVGGQRAAKLALPKPDQRQRAAMRPKVRRRKG